MNYQPFLNMNVLVSDALLASVPVFMQLVLVCVAAFAAFKLLSMWLNSDI
jgi:hypothetical protein